MSQVSGRRHFHTFDALRFFAFFKVFLLHLPIYAFPWFSYMKAGGGIGVQFFFVLSGFLITYIICEEKQKTGKLDLKNFFARRILRIWPLYYLMVIVAYSTPYILSRLHLTSSAEGYEPNIWASVFFLENYRAMITHSTANVSPLSIMWSLCIEEHFYIVWGLLLYFCSLKNLPKILFSCLIIGPLCRIIYVHYNLPTSDILTTIDLFAFGAMPAWLLVSNQQRTEEYIKRIPKTVKMIFILAVITIVLLCSQTSDDTLFIGITSLLGIIFAILIAFTLTEKNGIKISDKNVLSRMGVYTYGLYLYHILVIILLHQVYQRVNWNLDEPIIAIGFVAVSLLFTFICAWLSYHLFEKHFLKLKRYFR